jgi:hypothetical protein
MAERRDRVRKAPAAVGHFTSRGPLGRLALCAALALLGLLAVASPSFAIETHVFDEEFTSVCPAGKTVQERSVDYAH